jgi:hypothetical protein
VKKAKGITALDSGITRQTRAVLGDLASVEAGLAHAEARSTFDGLVREVEAEAGNILRTAMRGPGGVLRTENDSPEDYAERITRLIQLTRSAIDSGDAGEAARFSFRLGHTVCEARMKGAWERLVLIGAKSQIGAGEGGRERARKKAAEKDYDQRDMKMAREFLEEVKKGSRRSKSKIKENVGKRHQLGRSRAIEAINNGLSLLDKKSSCQPATSDS